MRTLLFVLLAGCAAQASEADEDGPGFLDIEDMSPLADVPPGSTVLDPLVEDAAAVAMPDAAATAVPITLTIGTAIAPVSPLQAGANHRWVDRGYGVLRNDGTLDTTVEGIAKAAGVGVLRYPAGTMANLWSLDRATQTAPGGCQVVASMTQKSNGQWVFASHGEATTPYSPVEHMAFAAAVGADTNIMVPFINNTPAGAAHFVEYMNATSGPWADRRAQNGHPAPYRIKHWELGNEPYFTNQRYWMSADYGTAMSQYIHGDHSTRFTDQQLAVGCDYATPAKGDGATTKFQIWYPPLKDAVVKVDGVTAHPMVNGTTGVVSFATAPAAGSKLTVSYTIDHAGFADFVAAMKQVDSSIDVCSEWGRNGFVDQFSGPLDCVATHVYTILNTQETPSTAGDLYRTLMAGEDEHGDSLASLVSAMKAQHPNGYVEVTESGFLLHDSPVAAPEATQMHAVYTWSMFTRYLSLGLPLAQAGDLTSTSMRSLVSRDHGTWVTSVNALALQLFSNVVSAGGHSLHTTLSSNPTAGPTKFDMLRVAATRGAGGNIYVLVANRDLQRDAVIQVPGLAGTGEGHAWTIEGPIDALNTAAAPQTLQIQQFTLPAGRHKYTVKAHSIALFKLIQP